MFIFAYQKVQFQIVAERLISNITLNKINYGRL